MSFGQMGLPKSKEAITQRIAGWRKTAERYDSEPETQEGRKELAARAKAAKKCAIVRWRLTTIMKLHRQRCRSLSCSHRRPS